jgi:hypothetical protein
MTYVREQLCAPATPADQPALPVLATPRQPSPASQHLCVAGDDLPVPPLECGRAATSARSAGSDQASRGVRGGPPRYCGGSAARHLTATAVTNTCLCWSAESARHRPVDINGPDGADTGRGLRTPAARMRAALRTPAGCGSAARTLRQRSPLDSRQRNRQRQSSMRHRLSGPNQIAVCGNNGASHDVLVPLQLCHSSQAAAPASLTASDHQEQASGARPQCIRRGP